MSAMRCDLPVDVRRAHHVVVDEVDRAHAAAGECLGAEAAHAPDAEHGHARTCQRVHGFGPEEQLRAREPIGHALSLYPEKV